MSTAAGNGFVPRLWASLAIDQLERGAAMQNMAQERALASSGQLQGGQNVGQGQMVAADFILTPNVVFSDPNAGGVGGGIGGLLGSMGGRAAAVGALAGGVKFKEAQTAMTIADTRSGIQVAAAQGSASQTDINLGAAVFGRYGGGGLGGYTSTAEGKIIARPAQEDEVAMKLLRTLSIVSRRRWPEWADKGPSIGVPPPKKKADGSAPAAH